MERAQDSLPLQDATKQIRLLKLALQLDDERGREHVIRCTLSVHNLADVANQYIAVSYIWGGKDDMKTILVNGRQQQVRFNCWFALKQLQTHSNGYYCFIDSICIDQESHREKGEQVGQMGSIYSQAKLVVACLGPITTEQESYMQHFNSYMVYETPKTSGYKREVLEVLQHISQREYFTRVWTIQECMLARKVDLLCGESRLDSDILGSTLEQQSYSVKQIATLSRLAAFIDDCGWRIEGAGPLDSPRASTLAARRPLQPAAAILRYAPLWDILWDYISVHDFLVDVGTRRTGEPTNIAPDDVGNLGEFMLSIRILVHQFALASFDFQTALAEFWTKQKRKRHGSPNARNHNELDLTAVLSNLYTKRASECFTFSEVSYNDESIIVGVRPIRYHRIGCSQDGLDVLINPEQSERLERIGLYPIPDLESDPHDRSWLNNKACRCCLQTGSGAFTYRSMDALGNQESCEDECGNSGSRSCSSPHQLLGIRTDKSLRGMVFQVPNGTKNGDVLLSIGSSPPTTDPPSSQSFYPPTPRQFLVCREIPARKGYKTLGSAFHRAAEPIGPPHDAGLWTYGLQQQAVISHGDILRLSLSSCETLFRSETLNNGKFWYSLGPAVLSMPMEDQYPQIISELEQHVAHFIACDADRQLRDSPFYGRGMLNQESEDHGQESHKDEEKENIDEEEHQKRRKALKKLLKKMLT